VSESPAKSEYLAKRPGFGVRTGGSFAKGDGRPRKKGKVLWDGITFRDACRAEVGKCLKLLKKARDDESVPWVVRVAAARELLDRGFGKSTQHLEVSQRRPLSELNREELRQEIEALRAQESPRQRVTVDGECSDVSAEPVTGTAVVTASNSTLTQDVNALSGSVYPAKCSAECTADE
jgi:hypothetical protein